MPRDLVLLILLFWQLCGFVGGLAMLNRFREDWFKRFNAIRPTTKTDVFCLFLMSFTGPVGLVMGICFNLIQWDN